MRQSLGEIGEEGLACGEADGQGAARDATRARHPTLGEGPRLDERVRLVDLPGYGFAKVSRLGVLSRSAVARAPAA